MTRKNKMTVEEFKEEMTKLKEQNKKVKRKKAKQKRNDKTRNVDKGWKEFEKGRNCFS